MDQTLDHTTAARRSRLVRIGDARTGWIGLLERLDPLVRDAAAGCGGVITEALVSALEARLAVTLDPIDRRMLRSPEDLIFALAHAVTLADATASCVGPVRVRVGGRDAFVEYHDRPTPYFLQQVRDAVAHEVPRRPVEVTVPDDEGLRAWVALGRALRVGRRMNRDRARRSLMTTGSRSAR